MCSKRPKYKPPLIHGAIFLCSYVRIYDHGSKYYYGSKYKYWYDLYYVQKDCMMIAKFGDDYTQYHYGWIGGDKFHTDAYMDWPMLSEVRRRAIKLGLYVQEKS